jgi:hypothetical protein
MRPDMTEPLEVIQIPFDLDSLTLGEMIAAEDASGKDISQLWLRSGHRRMLAVFVHQLRISGVPPSWSDVANLRLHDVPPLTSDFSPDGDSRE